jgi:hypothetical protein
MVPIDASPLISVAVVKIELLSLTPVYLLEIFVTAALVTLECGCWPIANVCPSGIKIPERIASPRRSSIYSWTGLHPIDWREKVRIGAVREKALKREHREP